VRVAVLVAAAAALAACGGHAAPSVRAVSAGGVPGYLVTPPGSGRHPAVVLVHGSGGDRKELLPYARELAGRGVVALTITEPSTSHPPAPVKTLTGLLSETRASQLADVAAVRRAATYLAARSDVDPGELGYLGWSAGAKTGALVAASDRRFHALVLLSAGAATVEQFALQAPAGDRAQIVRALKPIDPIHEIAKARPGTVLLEDGTRDQIVPHAALENVVHAAPAHTTVRWYATGHALSQRAYDDAFDWLVAKLGT
jgi:dienelactone hydrolase